MKRLISGLVLCCVATPARAQWEAQRTLTSSGALYSNGVAASGTIVHVIWGSDPIQYSRSTDEGVTFSQPRTLVSSGTTHPTGPIVGSGSNVYLVFARVTRTVMDDCCPRELIDLYLVRSQDGGATWMPQQQLTTSGAAFRYEAVVSESRIDLVWSDYRSGAWEIYYRKSTDNGATWMPEMRLATYNGVNLNRPRIASQGNNIHVAWDFENRSASCSGNCFQIYYKRSTDGGNTWGNDTPLTPDTGVPGGYVGLRPSMVAVGPSTVLIAYDSNRDDNVASDGTVHHEQELLRSTDNGGTWEPPMRLTFTPGESTHGSFVASRSSGHHVWCEVALDRTSHSIHYRSTYDEGATWSADEMIGSSDPGDTVIAYIATTPNFVHTVWPRGDQLQYSRRALVAPPSPDGGATPDGSVIPDSGSTSDGAVSGGANSMGGGCGCVVGGRHDTEIPALLLIAIVLVLRRRFGHGR